MSIFLSLSVFDHPKNFRHFSTLPNVFNNVAILQYQDFSKLFKSKLCLLFCICVAFLVVRGYVVIVFSLTCSKNVNAHVFLDMRAV